MRYSLCLLAAYACGALQLFSAIRMPDGGSSSSPLPHRKLASNTVIVGSGPTGLATAIMLARRGYTNIRVFDRLGRPPAPDDASVWGEFNEVRSYNIGVISRGQIALRSLGVLDKVKSFTSQVTGRKSWAPQTKLDEPVVTSFLDKGDLLTRVLQRDRLASVLLQEIEEKYSDAVKVCFNTVCESMDWINLEKESERCRLTLKDISNKVPLFSYLEAPLVVGADGANSAVREAVAKRSSRWQFRVHKFRDTNVRVYRTIPMYLPPDSKKWPRNFTYTARLQSDLILDSLCSKEGVHLGVVIFRPWDKRVTELKGKEDAKVFFETFFPMFADFIKEKDMESFAQKEPSSFPLFSYAGPQLHKGKSCVLLGDCIHTVKPFFGLGVNVALEDVTALDKCLEKHDDDTRNALTDYSKLRGKEAKALVTLSRQLDGGFLTFILPLIIDSFLNKALPKVFSPSTVSSMMNEKRTFREISRRKTIDRILQLILASSFLAGVGKLFVAMSRFLRMGFLRG